MKAFHHKISRRKVLLPIPFCAAVIYSQAASHLREFYHRPPSAHTLILLALRRPSLEEIIDDFQSWNDLTRKYSRLTPRQRRQRQKSELLEE